MSGNISLKNIFELYSMLNRLGFRCDWRAYSAGCRCIYQGMRATSYIKRPTQPPYIIARVSENNTENSPQSSSCPSCLGQREREEEKLF